MAQPLSTGAKVAIGCVAVLVLGGIVTMVLLGGALWWGKSKMDQVTGGVDNILAEQTRIEELKKKANAHPFTAPADGVIQEDRLLTFIEVRKRVHDVYRKYETEIEARAKKDKADFGDVGAAFGMLNEIRGAQARAQADLGMSDEEYGFLVQQVYKTMWASQVAKDTGGKSVSEASSEAYEKATREMARAEEEARAAESRARIEGNETARKASEDAAQAMREGLEQLQKQAGQVRESAQQMDVPPANVALFQKHEAAIKKYAMNGLEWIGL